MGVSLRRPSSVAAAAFDYRAPSTECLSRPIKKENIILAMGRANGTPSCPLLLLADDINSPPNAPPYPPSLHAYHHYQNWRPYAIYRLEHWGLQYVNNAEVTDDEILAANGAYGGLAELAVLVLPPQQLAAIARKLDLAPAAQHSQQQTNASHPHQQVSFLSPTKHKSDAAVRSSEIR